MKLYLAGPLFSLAERTFNTRLAAQLRSAPDISVILPQERASELLKQPDGLQLVFEDCLKMVADCDVVVAVLDGPDADSGTCVELGYAYALHKRIVGIRTDFRGSEDRGLNLMVSHICSVLILDRVNSIEELAGRILGSLH
jgi:nucleoside 2-deoxyribosyltransferase